MSATPPQSQATFDKEKGRQEGSLRHISPQTNDRNVWSVSILCRRCRAGAMLVCLGSVLKRPLKAPRMVPCKAPWCSVLPVFTALRRIWRSGIGFCHSYFLRFCSEKTPQKKLKDYLVWEDPKYPAIYRKMMGWGIINGLILIIS